MGQLTCALRQLAIRPGASLAMILMLALGLGATTAIFTLFQQILLQPLPVREPETLVNLAAPGPKSGSTSCSFAGECDEIFSYPMFRDLEAQQTVFRASPPIATSTPACRTAGARRSAAGSWSPAAISRCSICRPPSGA